MCPPPAAEQNQCSLWWKEVCVYTVYLFVSESAAAAVSCSTEQSVDFMHENTNSVCNQPCFWFKLNSLAPVVRSVGAYPALMRV